MTAFSEYGVLGAAEVVLVEVVEEDEDEELEAPSASCKLGSNASEMIRMKTSNDRDFMKTLQADNLRY